MLLFPQMTLELMALYPALGAVVYTRVQVDFKQAGAAPPAARPNICRLVSTAASARTCVLVQQ